ncbi:hypothetical protein Gogos_010121, partial [Gossypium gossypioides]|nr:hypothetical protein [Gossypium gossypioides]
MEEILRFSIEGKEILTYGIGTEIPETFNQELMTPRVKLWMEFVCQRIWPIVDLSNINPVQAILVYAI